MTETKKNDLGYLGTSFQQKVLWQLLICPEFAEKIIPSLTASYFDNQLHKFIMSMIKKYFEENKIPANLKNRSIYEYINGSNKSDVDKELAHGVLNQIMNFDKNVINGQQFNDGEVIQRKIWFFVKQQEYKKLGNELFQNIEKGELEENNVNYFEEKFKIISKLGEKLDLGKDVFDKIDDALEKDYREPVPTGIKAIDQVLSGGLGKGEMGLGLIPYGIGKTTLGTKFANSAFNFGKNVLQIIFEDKEKDIQRKHYTLWTKIPLSELDERSDEAKLKVKEFLTKHNNSGIGGRIVILKLDQDGITIPYIKNWILNYQKTYGIVFDLLVLDYLDCVESHKPNNGDSNDAELIVVKSFLSLLDSLNIPGWTFVQGNRSSIRSEFVTGDQMGGSVKRGQKTHFLFSVAKSQEQKQNNLANIQIIKSRVTKDGQSFENAIFNNDTLEIRCIENMMPSNQKVNTNNQPLYDSIFQNAVNKLIDEQARDRQSTELKNNNVDNQEDKKIESNL